MKKGLMVDLHGTLLYSNLAWALAYESFDGTRGEFYRQEIEKKRNRHELAQYAGIAYELLLDRYELFLTPRVDVIEFIKNQNLPMVIVSNAQKKRVVRDLTRVSGLAFDRIYSQENGIKPASEYLESILKENEWDFAYLVGNDVSEDYSENSKVLSIILPQPKLCRLSR